MDTATRIMNAVNESRWDEIRQLVGAEPALAATRDAAGVSLLMQLLYRGQADTAAFVAGHITADIFEASAIGDTRRLAEILAATPAAVHAQSVDGWTALHLAGFTGQLESARMLLAHGADLSAYGGNYMRNMPLHAALAGRQNLDLIRLLLEHGAAVNATG